METAYGFRYGVYAQAIHLQHCLLAANGYQSWRSPTGQNQINWTSNGWDYVRRLYRNSNNDIKEYYPTLHRFLRAMLKRELFPPPSVLYDLLTEDQQETFVRYYYTHRDDVLLPEDKFGDAYTVRGLLLYQSLWLGAGFPAREFVE